MGNDQTNEGRVSSPAATGGAGTYFEQHVAAYWLSQLLVGAIPPVLSDCVVDEVHLQTEHLGWHTDDVLVVGRNDEGTARHLAAQVKRTFTVSSRDTECRKTLQAFWRDFNNAELFSPSTDRLVLITRRGTNTLLEHFAGLLDFARASRTAEEFEGRLTKRGLLNAKSIAYCDAIKAIVEGVEGTSVSRSDLWPFLRVLHVLSLDLHTATRQTEVMLRTLLAKTANEQNQIAASEATWNCLLREAGDGAPKACKYRRRNLPESVRLRHDEVGLSGYEMLSALRDHSAFILDDIKTSIGDSFRLERTGHVQKVIKTLETKQVVLLSGKAGSGKSVIAKRVIRHLEEEHFACCFRAEEFAVPHLDETLRRGQIPSTGSMFGAILASQERKVLLVESMERLLERDTQAAFPNLLTLVSNDPGWRVILTCRDDAVDPVQSAFLRTANLTQAVITVPELTDTELEDVRHAFPALDRPLADTRLRGILRNPYVLDKALQIDWSSEERMPQSERDFRQLYWREVVRAEHRTAGSMPRRREKVFTEIALHRARALTQFAPLDGIDAEVVDSLRRDSLVVESHQSKNLVAPAHDLLEDWAVLHWIEDQHALAQGSLNSLAAAVGTAPSVRRAYRQWVTELVDRRPKAADRLFGSLLRTPDAPAKFTSDTFISLLRSSASVEFLSRHHSNLFANGKRLLRRVIHLLRVACVALPAHWEALERRVSILTVPTGPAWGCVMQLVEDNLESFGPDDESFLFDLLDDWARGVTWQNPYPAGAESAAAIAHHLLPSFEDQRSESQFERLLEVLARLPKAAPDQFESLLRGDAEEKSWVTQELRRLVFNGVAGTSVARDMPELLVAVGWEHLLCDEADIPRNRRLSNGVAFPMVFGFHYDGLTSDYASALRGPWFVFLREHPRRALDFILDVVNRSADWYSNPRVTMPYVERPDEIELTFSDGETRTQWSSERLWRLYRGTSDGPCAFRSLLMALEKWLLECVEKSTHDLNPVLLPLLRKSNSVALTSIIASVAVAYPARSGEALLVLLDTPELIRLDRQRCAQEVTAPSGTLGMFASSNASDKIYEDERRDSDALPHRSKHLLHAAQMLLSGPLATRVTEILERHDLLKPPQATSAGSERPEQKEEEDSPDHHAAFLSNMGLLMWGQKVFKREDLDAHPPAQWRVRFEAARAIWQPATDAAPGIFDGGPACVTAVCVRDHWQEMSCDERSWCVDTVCSEVEHSAARSRRSSRPELPGASGALLCAQVLPLLVGRSLSDEQTSRCRRALVQSLAHPDKGIRVRVATGIGEHVWQVDRGLALRCVNALAMLSTSHRDPRGFDDDPTVVKGEAALVLERRVYELLFERDGTSLDMYEAMNVANWDGAEANILILSILARAPHEQAAIEAFKRLARTLVNWWAQDRDPKRTLEADYPSRSFNAERDLSRLLEHFLLWTQESDAVEIARPLIEAVDRHSKKVSWLLQGLITVEADQPNTDQFWKLWQLFADAIRRASWLDRIDGEHAAGRQILATIFLVPHFGTKLSSRKSLGGYVDRVHNLFRDLPSSAAVFEYYLRFLHDIGAHSLPEAFVHIAAALDEGDHVRMLSSSTTLFYSESLLQGFVYGNLQEFEHRAELRDAVLHLLELMVEGGSSVAFQMRDDFVANAPKT